MRSLRCFFSNYAGNQHRTNTVHLKEMRSENPSPMIASLRQVGYSFTLVSPVCLRVYVCVCVCMRVIKKYIYVYLCVCLYIFVCVYVFCFSSLSHACLLTQQLCLMLYEVLSRYVAGSSRKNKLYLVKFVDVFQVCTEMAGPCLTRPSSALVVCIGMSVVSVLAY